jgi:hypothetical protein
MSDGQILREEGAYRRGMVLGLTVAEIMILVLFVLLLLLASTLNHRDKEIERLSVREAQLTGEVRDLNAHAESTLLRLAQLQDRLAAAPPTEVVDELWRELVTRESALERARIALIAAEADRERATHEIGAWRLKYNELTHVVEQAGGTEAVGQAGGIAAVTKRLAAALGTSDDPLYAVEILTEGVETLIAAAPELADPKSLLDRLQTVATLIQERDDLIGQKVSLQQQIKASGRGIDPPPCWLTRDGKAEYIFAVSMTDAEIVVRDIVPPHRRSEFTRLPVTQIELDTPLSRAVFLRQTRALYDHSVRSECRFHVTLRSEARAMTGQDLFLTQKDVEQHFYKRLDLR